MNHGWRHTDPYPTNPFERVDGKELERLHRLLQPKQPQPKQPQPKQPQPDQPIYEEALL
jgi:hypothetical protein